MRLHKYFQQQQLRARQLGNTNCAPFRVTPGMYAELQSERPDNRGVEYYRIHTCNGSHKVELIECPTRATGDNVILAPREDLFAEVERDTGIELVSLANDVTSVPDNIACCEIISVGELVTNVKPGDLAFIDFYDMKQGYILQNDELYIAGSDAFRGLFDVAKQEILPLANYVVTRRATDRFKVALNGTDRIHVPSYILTDGIAGGKTSMGDIATHILYEEVVSVGPLTNRPRPGVMTTAERGLIERLAEYPEALAHGDDVAHAFLGKMLRERANGRTSDVQPGDLVVFCKEIATPVRVRGEFQHIIPHENVLSIIDDREILDKAIRSGKAGILQVA